MALEVGPGETVQWLRTLVALVEDLGLVHSTYMMAPGTTYIYSDKNIPYTKNKSKIHKFQK